MGELPHQSAHEGVPGEFLDLIPWCYQIVGWLQAGDRRSRETAEKFRPVVDAAARVAGLGEDQGHA